jgi:hypothetical protein
MFYEKSVQEDTSSVKISLLSGFVKAIEPRQGGSIKQGGKKSIPSPGVDSSSKGLIITIISIINLNLSFMVRL